MKIKYLVTFGIFLNTLVFAQPVDKFGVGIIIGDPTGISLKKWMNEDRAVDAGIAWTFSENDSLQLHTDYLIHQGYSVRPVVETDPPPTYFGLGLRIQLREGNNGKGRNDKDDLIGVRIPLGLTYGFPGAPMDFFAEAVPILDVLPEADFTFNLAIGTRYYF